MTSSGGELGRSEASRRIITAESISAKEAVRSKGTRGTNEGLEATIEDQEVVRRDEAARHRGGPSVGADTRLGADVARVPTTNQSCAGPNAHGGTAERIDTRNTRGMTARIHVVSKDPTMHTATNNCYKSLRTDRMAEIPRNSKDPTTRTEMSALRGTHRKKKACTRDYDAQCSSGKVGWSQQQTTWSMRCQGKNGKVRDELLLRHWWPGSARSASR